MTLLRHVALRDLRTQWPAVRAGLDEIQRRAPDDGWIAEDVYYALRSGTSSLWLIGEFGFLVATVLPGDDGRGILFVWLIHGDLFPVKQELERELETLARALPVARIRFGSPRRWDAFGWGRLVGHIYEVTL